MELFKILGTVAIDGSGAKSELQDVTGVAEQSQSKISGAFEKIGSAAVAIGKTVGVGLAAASTAVAGLAKSALDGYAEYEQLVGGVETLFKDSASKVQEYASNAYKTAGISANDYMTTVTSFSASLLQSLASSTSEAGEKSVEATAASLEAQYDAVKDSNEKKLAALEEAHEAEYDAVVEANEERLEQFEAAYAAEVELAKAATDQKIAEIDREYKESLKLIDEEKYNKLKAIDEQIEALNAQTQAEKDAREQRENDQKIAALNEKIRLAETHEAKAKAQQDLDDLLADIAQKAREKERKAQIEALKDEKDLIKEEADAKKNAAKEQHEAEVQAVKDAEEAKLETMKEAHEEEAEVLKKANEKQLKDLKKSQKAEVDAMKSANKERLAETSAYVEEQMALLEQSSSASVYTAETYEQAAEKANMAIIDMSDNANKMGTSMESIQNAYQGFAKQNFTMLDNLKLGYGGTKEEMQRLLEDAQAISGIEYDVSSYADIVDAIHVIQTEMGITGTTAKEASTTIQGSFDSMKAAWQNLVTGLGNEDADLSGLINQFVASAETVMDNVLPRIEIILGGITDLIAQIMPKIAAKLPELLNTALPSLIEAAVQLFNGLVAALPTILQILIEQMPYIVSEIARGLAEAFPVLLETVESLFGQIWDYISLELLNTGVSFEDACTKMSEIFNTLWGVVQDVWAKFGQPVFDIIVETMDYFSSHSEETSNTVSEIFETLWSVCQTAWDSVGQPIFDTIESVLAFLKDNWETIMDSLSQLFDTLWAACQTAWETIGQPVFDIIKSGLEKVKGIFEENMPKIQHVFEEAIDVIENVWNSILKPAFEAIGKFIENVLAPAFEVGFGFISDYVSAVFDYIVALWDEILKPAFDGICDFVENVFAGNWSGAWEAIVDTFEEVFGGIADVAKVPINFVIEYVNKAIDAINGLSFDVPDWVPGIGGEVFGFNIPNIPQLAKGGVLEKGQVGLLEGTGAEAVVPLENNAGWISKVAQDLGAVTGNDAVLREILAELREIRNEMPDSLLEAIAALKFEISNREFARLVKAVN